ncbi:MAG TPA: energy transducer TonB [Myxococcota bacterium]|nr:energy transducer TonB [Myxococcota bacterium]
MRLRASALLLCLAVAASAEPPNPYETGTTTIGVDGASAPPSVQERVAWIRARLAEVLVYPKTAQRKGFEGTSRIQFVIGPDGRAREIRTVESSGHRVLDRAAEQSAIDAGELPRILGRLDVPVRFSLEEERRRTAQ